MEFTAGTTAVPHERLNVLVVDDDEDMRELLCACLGRRWAVETACDGIDALAVVERRRPDLIVSDLKMPRLDGLALLRRIRSDRDLCAIPLVMISSDPNPDRLLQAFDLGVDDYLEKPFSMNELLLRVVARFEIAKSRWELQRQRMEECQRRLDAYQYELRLKNGALEEICYSLAHDLRAPLRSVHGLTTALAEDFAPFVDANGIDLIQRILKSVNRMDHLVRDLIAFGKLSYEPVLLSEVSLASAVDEAMEKLQREIAERQAIVTTKGLEEQVLANQTLLSKALVHLLRNALKFVAPGVAPRIEIWSEARGQYVRTYVTDNGVGIDVRHQERIFEIFERLQTSEVDTGIGLALVKKSVHRMGGNAGVQSDLKKGSSFWVELKRGDG